MIVKNYLFTIKTALPWQLFLRIAIAALLYGNIAHATYPPTFSDCLRGDGEDYDQLDACQQLVRSNPKNHDLRVALGKTLDKRQKYRQAVVAYKKALLAFPGDSYFLKKQAQAKSNLEEQQWIKNKNKRKTAAQAKNNSSVLPQYRLNKVRCIRLTGKKALEACDKAIKINAKDASLFVSKGDIYASQQQNKSAIAAYQTAVALNPKDKRTSKKLNTLLHNNQKREKQKEQSKNIVRKSNKTNNKKVTKPVKTKAAAKTKVVEKAKTAGKTGQDEKAKMVTKSKTVAKPSPIMATQINTVASEAKTVTTATEKAPQVKEAAIVLNARQQEFITQLNLLKSLKEQQIISQAEYDRRKKHLLDSTFRISEPPAKKTESLENNISNDFADINFGNYYALIIGNNQYIKKCRGKYRVIVSA